MYGYGDIIICMEDVDTHLHVGAVLTVQDTHAEGQYVELAETGPGVWYSNRFFELLAKRPWHAWGEDDWGAKTKARAKTAVVNAIKQMVR